MLDSRKTRAIRGLGLVLAVVGLSGCGGSATADGASGGAAGAGTGGAGASQGSGGSGATGGVGATGGMAGAGAEGGAGGAGGGECVPAPDTAPFEQPTCADLDRLTVSDGYLESAAKPGTQVMLHVSLTDISGKGFNFYPGVVVVSDNPGVTVSDSGWLYAILECQTMDIPVQLTIGKSVAPGTVVTLTANVAMLNEECPGTNSTKVTFTVE